MDLLPSSPPDAEEVEMGPPPVPSAVVDKGKGREEAVGEVSSPSTQPGAVQWGRDTLMWEDLAELVTQYQTRPLVFTSQNVVIASLPATPSIFLSSSSTPSGIIPQPRLQAYPLPASPARPSSPSARPASFAVPLPPFNLPHMSPTYLSTSPSASFLIAFFPLSGPQGQGGTLVIWEVTNRGTTASDWEVKDTWAVPGGKEVIDIAWLGTEREWTATTPPPPVVEEDLFADEPPDASSGTPQLPTFHRLPPLGPPLPSNSSSTTPPTFLILTASHEIVLHYPVASPTVDSKWPLRTARCSIFGAEVGVAGLPDATAGAGAEGLGTGEEAKGGKRVRRGKILVRAEDPSVYIVVQSSVAPPAVATLTDVMTDSNLLGSLGLGGDFDDVLGELPVPAPNPEDPPILEVGDDASGDEPWVEFIECKIDLLGSEATISALLFPPVHFAATSSDQDQDSSEFVTSSAILSHLSFVELADLESDPATVELSADRDIGVVGTFVNRTDDGHTSEMHLWKLKKEEAAPPDAFPLLETKPSDTPQSAASFEWHGSHLSRRVFLDSVVSSIVSIGPESLGVALVGEISQTWVEGVVGKFAVMKLSDLSSPPGWSTTDIRTRPARRALPISVATSANSALVASFESSLAFYAHPAKAPPLSVASTPADWSKLCDELASSLGLSLYRNSDPSDLIRLMAEGSKRRDDPPAVDAVLRQIWEVLMAQQSAAEPFGESEWLLPLMEIQRRMYESIGDDRANVASEVLRLASSNAVFSRAFVEGRGSEKDAFQIDSIWSLIAETSTVLSSVSDLLRTVLLERSWTAWDGPSEDFTSSASPRLLILHHPTTRSLLQSLLSQIASLSSFLSTLTSPIPNPNPPSPNPIPDLLAASTRSTTATDLARNRLQDIISRSGLDLSLLSDELETLDGTMGGEGAEREELDGPLLSLAIPPARKGDGEKVGKAVEGLSKRAVEKVRVLLEPAVEAEEPKVKKRRVEQQQGMDVSGVGAGVTVGSVEAMVF